MATHGDPLASNFFVNTLLHKALAESLVGAEARPTVFVFQQIFHRQLQKLGIAIFVHAHGQVAGDVDGIGGIEN